MTTEEVQPSAAEFLAERPWLVSPAAMAMKFGRGRWQPAPHLLVLSQYLVAVATGRIPRLIVCTPPRHGKSSLVSKWLPAWYLSLLPENQIIFTTYGAEFAEDWGAEARNILTEHQATLGLKLRSDTASKWEWKLTAGGGMIATGVGGPIMGRGANLFIIDDPIKTAEEAYSDVEREKLWKWWLMGARTRLEPGAGVVLIMTRWHHDDLAGRLLAQTDEPWTELRLPALAERDDLLGRAEGEALWPTRIPAEQLDLTKRASGPVVWNAMYQQRPTPEEGGLLKGWRYYNPSIATQEWLESLDRIIQSWDTSFKDSEGSDYVVGEVWGRKGPDFYLLDIIRERLNFPATISAIKRLSERWPLAKTKLIEESANGYAILQSMRHEIPGLVPVSAHGTSKVLRVSHPLPRLHAVSALVDQGRVFVPEPLARGWVKDFIQECLEFPHGAHDDQVDAMSQALIFLQPGSWAQKEPEPEVLDPLATWTKEFWSNVRERYYPNQDRREGPERYKYLQDPRTPFGR